MTKECLEGGKLTVTEHLPILQLLLSESDTEQSLDFQPSLDSHLEGDKDVNECGRRVGVTGNLYIE